MERSIESEVIVFHDETRKAGEEKLNGHVLFFVPIKAIVKESGGLFEPQESLIEPLKNLIEEMEKIRTDFRAYHKFHFSKISGKKWGNSNCAEKRVVEIGVNYLRQSKYFCKLGIIFYEHPRPEHIENYGGNDKNEQELRFGETLLRMLLKGTVHYLYDKSHKVKILKIITDGQPHHRKLSEFRILKKLKEDVREYVEIPEDAELLHLSSNHRDYDKCSEEYVYANMLQLADMLLG